MAFDQAATILQHIQGVTWVPLSNVVCHKIPLEEHDDDPPCGKAESDYLTDDKEMVACAAILKDFTYSRMVNFEGEGEDGAVQSSLLLGYKEGLVHPSYALVYNRGMDARLRHMTRLRMGASSTGLFTRSTLPATRSQV